MYVSLILLKIFFSPAFCVKGPEGLMILEGITGFGIVILTDVIYYKRIQGKIIRKEGQGMKSGGNQARAFRSLLPVKSHRMHLIPPATRYEKHVKCCPPGKLIRDFMPRF